MPNKKPTALAGWKALKAHQKRMRHTHMRDLFENDSQRFEKFSLKIKGILFDYSKHLITEKTLTLLLKLATESGVESWRDQIFAGAAVNTSEKRAALHAALRGSVDPNLEINGENISLFVSSALKKIKGLSQDIRGGKFTDVVHIGIGGSDLGPHMVCEALKTFADGPRVHFVSNIDGAHITQVLSKLTPEKTAFIIASKTFTTLETLSNAQAAQSWSKGLARFIAVTANSKAALDFGVAAEDILPMRDWIGGRYSLWSGIGLPIAISTGFENFEKLLAGAREADTHFRQAPAAQNIPMIMGMLGIWYRNFWNYSAHAILPYAQDLYRLPAWAQQLDMESNGKNIDRNGRMIDYATSPIVFGEPGTGSQHAFFQLLHQGTEIVSSDFIGAIHPNHDKPDHHMKLLANMLAQSRALMQGRNDTQSPQKHFPGNRPSSTLILDRLDPWHLGLLLALYEHKIFVQGIVWNINSFDQWGVELGKELATGFTEMLENGNKISTIDSSSTGLLHHINNKR